MAKNEEEFKNNIIELEKSILKVVFLFLFYFPLKYQPIAEMYFRNYIFYMFRDIDKKNMA